MNGNKNIKLVFVGVFALILILPLVQMITGFYPEEPLLEYRKLSTFPDTIQFDIAGYKKCRQQFESWFDDHMGFRGTLIRLLNELTCRIFHVAELVYVGKDAWLFQKVFYNGAFAASQPGMDDHYKKVFNRWIKLNNLLKSRGITLVVFCIPMKHNVYPEYLPSNAPKMPVVTRFDQFRRFLNENEIEQVDIKKALIEGKKDTRVFRKQDIHWTIRGGFIGAKELLNKISMLELGHTIDWRFRFKFTKGELVNIGSESRALPLLNDLKEYWGETDPDGRVGFPYIDISEDNPWDRKYHMSGENLLPTAAVLNDSFFENMERCGLQYHFKTMYTGRPLTNDTNRTGINAVLKKLPPKTKYFITVFMENDLESILPERAKLDNFN